jgi:hypothetical protein
MNLYGYAGGDPVNFSDPFGLWPTFPGIASSVATSVWKGLFNRWVKEAEEMGKASAMGSVSEMAVIADEALVVRGGTNTAEQLIKGAEHVDADGMVHGVSVNSANGKSVAELAAGLPHNKIGVTTAGAIRQAGGDVLAHPTANLLHAKVSKMSAEELSKLLNPVIAKPQ